MPADKSVCVLVFDGMADWEAAYALAELRRWGKRRVVSVGFSREPVHTMGGLTVAPDIALEELDSRDVGLLILPGGDAWEGTDYPRRDLETLLGRLIAAETPVAAICAGTLALARAGILNDRLHTSTLRTDLAHHAPEYRGQEHYRDAPAVVDGCVITASGLAPVDFARAIFAKLSVFSQSDEQLWFDMYNMADCLPSVKPRHPGPALPLPGLFQKSGLARCARWPHLFDPLQQNGIHHAGDQHVSGARQCALSSICARITVPPAHNLRTSLWRTCGRASRALWWVHCSRRGASSAPHR
jgi:putative intracellular protease/amidase